MSERREELRDHMLFIATDVFVESGFDRASMDVIAARASTTKRTLYAHFESKEKLFLAVVELVNLSLLAGMRTPADYSTDPEEALLLFCGNFLESLLTHAALRMCRLTITEAERFPDGAARAHEAVFERAQNQLEGFLHERLKLSRKAATQTAGELLGRILYPPFTRALFGLDAGFDLKPIRRAVAELMLKSRK